ncbi:hypothetical protein BCR37DRAFT_381795 [Protomyces lactucae-debilis]|uniref:Yeast cell wall synthesis Kre9/Knh1-like N-terminal domain-containing protein n=1 Tax=Protomyces lactucae-debilis TaxID=2754530 RepID=A0A1Y2F618_PROLT|nr:uncharacterized protein BCR37DRAFT_381795 [Protomyces lactucae-debilis]ORY78934.1 hypothetical protein BCR37DRAFT_381795 [Protomyces lactucae-debilis]
MFSTLLSLSVAAFTAVSALSVTSPSLGQSIPQTADLAVTWATVSSDQQSFNIQLALSTDSGNARTLTTNVSPSTNGFTTPASAFSPGNYTVNLVGNSQTSSGVLAQSGWFLITAAQVQSSSSAGASAGGAAAASSATAGSGASASAGAGAGAGASAASGASGATSAAASAASGAAASGSAVSLGSGTVSGSTLGASAASSAASRASTAAGSATSRAAGAAITAAVGTLGGLVAGAVALVL